MIMDADVFLMPFHSPGVVAPSDTSVHAGFMNRYLAILCISVKNSYHLLPSWNAVAIMVIRAVDLELQAHPGMQSFINPLSRSLHHVHYYFFFLSL
jgi:hypothetical protein